MRYLPSIHETSKENHWKHSGQADWLADCKVTRVPNPAYQRSHSVLYRWATGISFNIQHFLNLNILSDKDLYC